MTELPTTGTPHPLAAGLDSTRTLEFPPGFRFGSATAAFQIEGAAHEEGREDSIWDAFCRVPGAVFEGHDGSVAADHYHRMPQDVALMAELGLDTYRFSTSWARIKPGDRTLNPKGLDFYSRLVDELLGRGIAPWLTLYHWDLPQALQERGGWANRDTAYRFADYALEVFEHLKDRVTDWTTLNEPWCSSFLSYAGGEHAPGHTNPEEAVAAAHHLLLGHGLATGAMREVADKDHRLGITLNFTVADPANPANAVDVDAARRIDGAFNRIFLDPIFRGQYPTDVLEDMAEAGLERHIRGNDLEVIAAPIDVLGVNYYNGELVAGPTTPPAPDESLVFASDRGLPRRSPIVGSEQVGRAWRDLPRTAMGWEVQPEGLERLLLRLEEHYTGPAGIPMVITENGAAYDDVADESGFVDDSGDRLSFIDAHLRATHRAMEQGADVRGYLVWSLMDNFEWSFGYDKRFGIVRVDYDTQARIPKASAKWYAQVAASHRLPARR
ncbi:family 1 glycosylhydrolase [Paeniglutamicibacter sulfureus]|uniref:glycoside hydrolase family 1 protein n=1 Tax=Paeniglutamicibacter sulfureus TaxID=43666 RepID=UPI002667042D|nr:family 1 glycosylhydrolase [Paeniglutamicibacter sulfureus]MDO2935265.1 family 1 glycosylhydrolase [Paeniglutamicibacter sulfureus]